MRATKKVGSPYSIAERRVLELIPVLGSQPAGDVSHKPAVGCRYFPPGPQLPSQPLRGLLSISLLGEQRHDGCEQFSSDCYPTASRLRFVPGQQTQQAECKTQHVPTQSSVCILY